MTGMAQKIVDEMMVCALCRRAYERGRNDCAYTDCLGRVYPAEAYR